MSTSEIEDTILTENIPIIEITENGIEGFDILCRLCANRSDHLIPIYSEEGISNDLPNKMNLYLPVKVSEADTLPLQCCFQCATTVLTWHELVIASVEADRRLRDLQVEAEKHFQEQSINLAQESLEVDEKTEIKTDSDDDRIKEFIKTTKESQNDISAVNTLPESSEMDTQKKQNHICKICGKNFTQKRYLINHLKIHNSNRDYTCEKCARNFVGHSGLIRHMKDVHLGIKNYSCSVCYMTFASSATRNDHVRRKHTSDKPYLCSFCSVTFSTRASLFQHKKNHQNVFPFVCKTCDKKFKRKHELTCHLTIHNDEKLHGCQICNKRFGVATALTRHLTVHCNDKTFQCQICSHIYKYSRSLLKHMKLKHPNC